ncbi:hypothetical protein B0A55_12752 [Friedmanniomyces simplex]|uniref:Glycosyltransferase 2-like domain-containing protein n=1 Tax=Friedmanniomyces simplex TaxID=329884 RepID=A0A4U0W4B1_9PEZI|nr:hypothetical protein B0A55_12752 [Friedmanniomyces simplex]
MAEYDEKRGILRLTVTSLPDDDHEAQNDQSPRRASGVARTSRALQRWTTLALLASYFIFSVALYTLIPEPGLKVFWFFYLTLATLVAGVTALEAYDGLTPLREAREAIKKAGGNGGKPKTIDDQLPTLHLIFDAGQEDSLVDADSIMIMAEGLMYPENKVTITILRTSRRPAPTLEYIGGNTSSSVKVLTIPVPASTSQSSRVAYCLALDSHVSAATITGVLAADERPHPDAARNAVERLIRDAKVDVVQGRDIKVPDGSMLDSLISIEHDKTHALLKPGGSLTWGFSMPTGTNAYWRTDALRAAATATAIVPSDGVDLPFSALARNVRTVFDMRVIAYSSCAPTLASYCGEQVATARRLAIATTRYMSLAFKRHQPHAGRTDVEWNMKKRFAILHSLPISRLVAHATVQYFCIALALLFVKTPHSAADLARLIYLPFPVSEWFIAMG